jgi:putative oligomerization/nucleic acid binding protein
MRRGEFVGLWPYIGVWVVFGIASLLIARSRGVNAASRLVMDLLLGPVGLILAVRGAHQPQREYTMEELNRLAEMRADGELTDEEYDAKRGELLGRMPYRR